MKFKEDNDEGDDGDMETEEDNDENEEEYSDDDDMSWKVSAIPFFSLSTIAWMIFMIVLLS